MASSNFSILPFSTTSTGPRILFLNTTEDYATITAPGFLNSVSSVGIEVQPNDFIFTSYDGGSSSGLFNVIVTDNIFSMEVYNPNSNSFIFSNLQFVAKGGSDLNPGTSIGLPKLTINAAISALALTPSNHGMVWVLDDNTYEENIDLAFNVQLFAPAATLTCNSGYVLNIADTGNNTLASVTASTIQADASGKMINILGIQSNLFVDTKLSGGDIDNEGGLIFNAIVLFNSTISLAANSQFAPKIINAVSVTLSSDPTAIIAGSLQIVSGGTSDNFIYGGQTVLNKLRYQTEPLTETSGRIIAATDSNSRIVYNNVSDDTYTLPQTSDVEIALGTNIEFTQLGLGAILFAAGAGVTIVSQVGALAKTNGAGTTCKAYKYTDTVWIISGDIVAQP